METRCHKCGALADDDQAFCSKCGAVIGIGGAGASSRPENPSSLAATVAGQVPFKTPPARPASGQTSPSERATRSPAQAPARTPASSASPPTQKGGNSMLLLAVGFLAVLLVGGLLIYLFLYNA